MYKLIIRPFLFVFPPEFIHHFVSISLKIIFIIPGINKIIRRFYLAKSSHLERTVFGITFPNPVGFAAGFDKKAELYNHLSNFGFGHVEIGTITPLPQPGNPKPRLFRLKKDKALINRMGFNNHGVLSAAKRLKKHKPDVIIGANIGKNTLTPNENASEDYCKCFEMLFDHVDYFAVNVSCPNISNLKKLADKDNLLNILQSLQSINQNKDKPKPILLKISPDLNESQIDDTLEVIKATKIDGIIATNTTIQRQGLKTSKERIEKIANGGLSGKPLKERSTEIISCIYKKTNGKIPIIGVGGINTPEDAIDKLKAGASLVQVYTGFIYEGPALAKKINKMLKSNF